MLVAGSGHSAMHVLQDLAALKRRAPATRIVWAIRRPEAPGDRRNGAVGALARKAARERDVRGLLATGEIELAARVEVMRIARTPEASVSSTPPERSLAST